MWNNNNKLYIVSLAAILLVIYGKGINSLNEELLIILISIFFFIVGIVWLSEMVQQALKEKILKVEEVINQMYVMRLYMLDTLKLAINKKFVIENLLNYKSYKYLEWLMLKIDFYFRKNIIKTINKVIQKILVLSLELENKYLSFWYFTKLNTRYKKINKNISLFIYFFKLKQFK